MLWCTLLHSVALSDLTHEDFLLYQRFLTDPQLHIPVKTSDPFHSKVGQSFQSKPSHLFQ